MIRNYKLEIFMEAMGCFTHAGFDESSFNIAFRNGDERKLAR
jgi:hypothetical protein